MKHTKLISGIIGIILGVVIAFFIPTPVGLSHSGMVVLASLVTANIFWIFNVIPSFVTGLLMLSGLFLEQLIFQQPLTSFLQQPCGLSLVV